MKYCNLAKRPYITENEARIAVRNWDGGNGTIRSYKCKFELYSGLKHWHLTHYNKTLFKLKMKLRKRRDERTNNRSVL